MYSRVHRSGAPDTTGQTTHCHTYKCQDNLNYGRDEDPAKSAYSRIALSKRGLSAAAASANRSQLGNMEAMARWQLLVHAGLGLGCVDEFKRPSAHRHTATATAEQQHT